MKIPGWWRVRHLYNDIIKWVKKTDSRIHLKMERLISEQAYSIKNIPLPSRSALAKVNSRKELLIVAHKHDLLSFYASENDKNMYRLKVRLFQVFFVVYKSSYKIIRLPYKGMKFLMDN